MLQWLPEVLPRIEMSVTSSPQMTDISGLVDGMLRSAVASDVTLGYSMQAMQAKSMSVLVQR